MIDFSLIPAQFWWALPLFIITVLFKQLMPEPAIMQNPMEDSATSPPFPYVPNRK
jgi:hypothetical protein